MRTTFRIGSRITFAAVCVVALAACGGTSPSVSADDNTPVTESSDEDASQQEPEPTSQDSTPGNEESASASTDHTPLSEIVGPDAAGFVGPLVLPEGTQVAVVARTGDSTAMTGTVELVVDHGGTWRVDQTLEVGFPDAPVMVGDLTGDGFTEIVVTMIGSTGGKSWDVIYRINPDGPTLEEIPFAVNELEPLLGVLPTGLTVYSVGPDVVSTSVVTCDPSCADDPGTPVDWYLDRSGSLILRPQLTGSTATEESTPSDDCLTREDIPSLFDASYGDPLGIDPASIASLTVDCESGWAMAAIPPNSTFVDGTEILLQRIGDDESGEWIVVDYGTGDICEYSAPEAFCAHLYNENGEPADAAHTPVDEPVVDAASGQRWQFHLVDGEGWEYDVTVVSTTTADFLAHIADSPPGEARLAVTLNGKVEVDAVGTLDGRNTPPLLTEGYGLGFAGRVTGEAGWFDACMNNSRNLVFYDFPPDPPASVCRIASEDVEDEESETFLLNETSESLVDALVRSDDVPQIIRVMITSEDSQLTGCDFVDLWADGKVTVGAGRGLFGGLFFDPDPQLTCSVSLLGPVADLRTPGPINFDSELLSGFDINAENESRVAEADPAHPQTLIDDTQALSNLTGWHWSNDMVLALGASYCNDWPEDLDDDGTGTISEIGKQSWALSIGPVLGIDAEAARVAIDASFDGMVELHQHLCE